MDAVNENYKIRPAELADVPEIFVLIKELADYERLLDEVVATEELLEETLFKYPAFPFSMFVFRIYSYSISDPDFISKMNLIFRKKSDLFDLFF